MSKFKVGDIIEYKYNLYSGVTFNIGAKFKITRVAPNGNLYLESIDNSSAPFGSYTTDQFEVVESNPVLPPEEVFEHLRKGTKLQCSDKGKDNWCTIHSNRGVSVGQIETFQWRIKPEPEVIELNGKKYREITD